MIELKLGKSRDPVNRGTVNWGFTVIAHVMWFYEIKVFVFLKAVRKKMLSNGKYCAKFKPID